MNYLNHKSLIPKTLLPILNMALTSQLGKSLLEKQLLAPKPATPTAPAPAASAPVVNKPTPAPVPTSNWSSGTSTNYQTGQKFQNAGSGPYTLENAQSQWYDAVAAAKEMAAKAEAQRNSKWVAPVSNKVVWTSVTSKTSNTSSNSQYNVPGKGWVVSTTPTTLEARLDAAKTKYGASDPRVQKIQQLMDLKTSRAKNSTGNVVKTPDVSALWAKIDTSSAKNGVDEMEVTDRNENLQNDRIDTAATKNDQKVDVISDAWDKSEADTTKYAEEYKDEFDAYKTDYAERQSKLEALESEQRSRIEEWNKQQTEWLANKQAGQQAEVNSKLWKLGVSETVMANAQNEIASNPIYQEQRAKLQKDYIDTLSNTTKEYQGMYDTIMKWKTDITESKRALAEQLLSKINENTEKISTIKQTGIDEMFKPVEAFQDKRLEDSNNAELSSKQNSEAQYRWAGMDSSARIAKLKDALYNYDPSISRAGLSSADFDKAAAEWDITKAVAMLATAAKNLTKANTWTGTSTNKKGLETAQDLAVSLIKGWYSTLEQVNTALAARTNLTNEQKIMVVDAFKEKLGWKAPLAEGVTQYENNATVAAHKAANNIF